MITLVDQTITIQGPCMVEDAEVLLSHITRGADVIDMSGCTLLHTACLQVLLAARVKLVGRPASAPLAQWVAPLFQILASTEN